MRNNFEHYDERLDRWWQNSTSHNHLDFMVGGPSIGGGMDQKDMFRVVDPATTDLVFWGEAFNLQSLVNEIQRILPCCGEGGIEATWAKSA
jgi:hypothetical protein